MTGPGRNENGDVSVIVMIEGAHREDSLSDEEGGLAVREFLEALGHRVANAADALERYFRIFSSHAIISGFQCCISGAFQPLMPWPPPSTVIRSHVAPTLCIASHMAVDCS